MSENGEFGRRKRSYPIASNYPSIFLKEMKRGKNYILG